jgi:hypothetical protein
MCPSAPVGLLTTLATERTSVRSSPHAQPDLTGRYAYWE